MELVEAEESVEPVEVRIFYVVVLACVRSRSMWLTRSYRASHEVNQCECTSECVLSLESKRIAQCSNSCARYRWMSRTRSEVYSSFCSAPREHRALVGSGLLLKI